ncbi:MAG: Tripartite-type tricarboxylate transporter, receptor component TctC [Ramlibacter sp.]|nr:Tripartite-type tricarboxylate transporter, receptor component TctC [Ramlibacter sp.]
MRRHFLQAAACAALACTVAASWAQDAQRYPAKPVRFIVPAAAGGPSDVIARLVAEKLGQALGQPVLVENKPGASLTLGTVAVARADPDGYTLLFTTSTPIVMVPHTMKKPPYDVQKDFTTVSHLGTTPLVLYVNAASSIHNLRDLVEAVKAKPEAGNFGSYGNGSTAHVLGEILNRATGMKMVHVPYKGVAPELQDLIGGQLMTATADIGTAAPLVKGGKIRPIAVTGTRRSGALPDVATFAEQGVSGMEPFSPWWGLFAPAQTPKAIVDQLSAEVAKIVRNPEVNARLLSFGIDPSGTTSAQANEITRVEMARWQAIIKDVSYINFE